MLDVQTRPRTVKGAMTAPAMRRFIMFGMVGATGVVVNMAVFWLLHAVVGLHYLLAAAVAIETAICSNYLLNNNWTFREYQDGIASWSGLTRYHAVSFGGMLINLIVLHVLAEFAGMQPMLANLSGIAAATAWNFWLNVYWTWRRPRAAVADLAN